MNYFAFMADIVGDGIQSEHKPICGDDFNRPLL